MADQKPWPTEIRLDRDKLVLTVTFDAGGAHEFEAEFLRVFSPSAEVQGHSPEQRRLIEAAFFEGFTHTQLAERFGLPLGTVKTRIRTGMIAMRQGLEHAV